MSKGLDSHALPVESVPGGVSSCYFFKSRLQEYAQKAGIRTPVYETIKEGPSHEPSFRSTVIVNDVRYDSLPGFSNRKAAEQSAAEVALMELANLVDMKFGISQPVHDTGLCKNLLQEYAQKMNYAIPLYECHEDNQTSRKHKYSCVLEIGGIKYIGASASTKKEAEIKVARTALLAIKSTTSGFEGEVGYHTVLPHKKKVTDLGISTQETAAALKPKKGRFKKKHWKKKRAVKKCKFVKGKMPAGLEANLDCQTRVESAVTGAVSSQHTTGTDNLEVNMDRQELIQVNVADAVVSIVETPVDFQIYTPAIHIGMHTPGTDNMEVNMERQKVQQVNVADAVVSIVETPVDSQIETPATHVGTPTVGTDNLEVIMDGQEVLQMNVADAVGSIVETPVDSQIETSATHIRIPAVSEIETRAVSQIETPVGSEGSGVANADRFHEPGSGLALMKTISNFTHPETCNKNLEKPVVSLDEGLNKEGESAAMENPDIGTC